jgi:hypothetical protein
MRKLLVYSLAMIGLALFDVCLLVMSMGVPYHDGPYVGHIHPPGFWRTVEDGFCVLSCVAACTGLLGGVGLVMFFGRRSETRTR